MAGSKKGERRGNARKRVDDPAPKPTARHQTIKMPSKASEDYMRQIVAVVNGLDEGQNTMMPREMMLEAQRYFHDKALMLKEHCQVLFEKLLAEANPEQAQELDKQLRQTEYLVRSEYLTAVEVAFKAAPYYHPKLSAVAIAGGSEGPIEILSTLLSEIDEATRGRPTWARPDLKLVGSG